MAERTSSIHAPTGFSAGQEVSWPQGHCTLRIDGPPSIYGNPPARWYGGPVLSGECAGGYVLAVPEDQLKPLADGKEAQ